MEFRKVITRADLTKFVVPQSWLGTLLPGNLRPGTSTPVEVITEEGMLFTLSLKIRPLNLNNKHFYEKPEFMAGGWTKFVAGIGLDVGNVLFFFPTDVGGRVGVRVHKNDMA